MKQHKFSSTRLRFPIANAFAVLIATNLAQATTYYWDDNASNTGFGTAGASGGTWAGPTAGPTAGWSLSSTGGNAFTAFLSDTGDDLNFGTGTATFGLATGSIGVSGTVNAGTITYGSQSGSITLTGGMINFGNSPVITANTAAPSIANGTAPFSSGTWQFIGNATTGTALSGANVIFTKSGAGSVVLATPMAFNPGSISVTQGTFYMGANNATTLNGGTYSGNISISSGTTYFHFGNFTQTYSGVISGGGNFTKGGSGTITLSGPNTYTGKTSFRTQQASQNITANVHSFNSVSGGTTFSSLGAPTTVANGTIDIGNKDVQASVNLTFAGVGETTDRVLNWLFNGTFGHTLTANNASGLLKFTSGMTSNVISAGTSGTFVLSGTGNGEIVASLPNLPTGGLAKSGTGTWTLSSANTYTGATNISGGILVAAHVSALPTSGQVQISSTTGAGTLRLATDTSVDAYFVGSSSSNQGTIISDRATAGAGITHILGATTLGNNICNFLAGVNVTSGTAGISLASVNLSGGGPGTTVLRPTTANLTIVGATNIGTSNFAKTLELAGTSTGNAIHGTISNGLNTVSLTKSNSSIWTLTGTNTFTGPTTVNAGTLIVNSPGSLNALSAVSVTGGTLGGNGTIGGNVTVAAAGSVAPGVLAAVGTLTIGGSLDISAQANGGTGKLLFELNAPTTNSDKIAVTGTLNIGTGMLGLNDFVFTNLGISQAGTYPLITATGGIIGSLNPNDLTRILGLQSRSLRINGTKLEVVVADVDTDNDGIPDFYELANTAPPSAIALDPGDDLETGGAGDGLTNLQEYQNGTNPNNPDTDGDGIYDGAEVNHVGSLYQFIPGTFTQLQAAADASARHGRVASFTNPADYSRMAAKARQTTQGHVWIGLSDSAAEGIWIWTNGNAATYNRWLAGEPSGGAVENHGIIVQNSTLWGDANENLAGAGYLFERAGLDPLNPDTDGDGLTDSQEINTTHSNPFLDDTDGDGLHDGAEVNTHGTSPLLTDTDADGINDRTEIEVYLTSPTLADSDADGFDDLFEINAGFNPTLNTSTPDALTSSHTAVELRSYGVNGVSYRIEVSTDLQTWTTLETDINGTGALITRFYSIENLPRRYFRVIEN